VETADIVIIGGGVVGASIAYHLGRRGVGSGVALLERDQVGSGSTARAVGGIRSQFSTELNIRMSLESVAFWRRFEDELGEAVDYREDGYLFLARTEEERAQFAANVELQNALGVPSRLLSPEDAATVVPGMYTGDLAAAAYNATDGAAGPNEATMAFARAARRAGVRILEGTEVTGIDVVEGRIAGVRTTGAAWSTRVVVNAAGPWAAPVGRLAGIDVPVRPFRREIFVSEPFAGLPERLPIVIDLHVGWYFRREGAGILMAGHKDDHPSYDTHVDWGGLSTVADLAVHRVPALEGASFGARAWAGLYDVSPDDHAILGPVDGVDGLYLACGFSGHGFQHSPATGRLVAELVLDGQTTGIDIAPLGLDRFARGAMLREPLTAHAGTIGG
jgi:sarcosine oxidase subunit beta